MGSYQEAFDIQLKEKSDIKLFFDSVLNRIKNLIRNLKLKSFE